MGISLAASLTLRDCSADPAVDCRGELTLATSLVEIARGALALTPLPSPGVDRSMRSRLACICTAQGHKQRPTAVDTPA